MSRRRVNHRLIRLHMIYTTEELAHRLGVHKNTVRHWVQKGLAPAATGRPVLFHGGTVALFLRNRKLQSKRKCEPGQMYCLRCREPRNPALDMADFIALSGTAGNLRGMCPVCHALMNRRVSLQKLAAAKGDLIIQFPKCQPHITDRANPSLNCDLSDEAAT